MFHIIGLEVNYFELLDGTTGKSSLLPQGVISLGKTQDGFGCRGACETHEHCSSFTFKNDFCYGRNDHIWFPNTSSITLLATLPKTTVEEQQRRLSMTDTVISGRPWNFDTDNPAPWIDPISGNVTIL